MSKNIFGSLGLLWMALPLFFVLYCPMAKYYSYSGPIDDVLLYLLFCILGYSEVQRQRLIFYDLTSVQHGTHHCLYILCYPYSKGELTLYYNLFCSKESTRECKLHSLSVMSNSKLLSAQMMTHDKVIISTWSPLRRKLHTVHVQMQQLLLQLNKPASTCIIMQSWRK